MGSPREVLLALEVLSIVGAISQLSLANKRHPAMVIPYQGGRAAEFQILAFECLALSNLPKADVNLAHAHLSFNLTSSVYVVVIFETSALAIS